MAGPHVGQGPRSNNIYIYMYIYIYIYTVSVLFHAYQLCIPQLVPHAAATRRCAHHGKRRLHFKSLLGISLQRLYMNMQMTENMQTTEHVTRLSRSMHCRNPACRLPLDDTFHQDEQSLFDHSFSAGVASSGQRDCCSHHFNSIVEWLPPSSAK